MQTKCEFVANVLIPAMRALIAKKLTEVYGLKQTEAASLMGVTQPAIFQYKKELRGKVSILRNYPEMERVSSEIAEKLVHGTINHEKLSEMLCKLCELV